MKTLMLTGLLAISIFGATHLNAQTYQKEHYQAVLAESGYDLQNKLNQYAKEGWKVRSFSVLDKGHMYLILYREAQ